MPLREAEAVESLGDLVRAVMNSLFGCIFKYIIEGLSRFNYICLSELNQCVGRNKKLYSTKKGCRW